jgi:hypothetical protein
MEVSGQLHPPVALPRGKEPLVPILGPNILLTPCSQTPSIYVLPVVWETKFHTHSLLYLQIVKHIIWFYKLILWLNSILFFVCVPGKQSVTYTICCELEAKPFSYSWQNAHSSKCTVSSAGNQNGNYTWRWDPTATSYTSFYFCG